MICAIKKAEKQSILEKAKEYCKEHSLSYDKLLKQHCENPLGIFFFLQESEVKPNGLCNDMEAMPYPTLKVAKINGKYVFEQTEYTKKYLGSE